MMMIDAMVGLGVKKRIEGKDGLKERVEGKDGFMGKQ